VRVIRETLPRFALFHNVILKAHVLCGSKDLCIWFVAVSAECMDPSLGVLGFAKDSAASRMTGVVGLGEFWCGLLEMCGVRTQMRVGLC
jgi:hypothetical protein